MKKIKRNTYCIVTPQLGYMGGAQIYCLRRARHLRDIGFEVKFVVSNDDNFLLRDKFLDFPILKIKEIAQPLFAVSSKIKSNITSDIHYFLGNNDVIFESHFPTVCVWGEIFAEKLNAKHVLYLLVEFSYNDYRFIDIKNFFLMKLRKNECVGISNISLELIFGKYFSKEQNNFVNIGVDKSELTIKTVPNLKLNKNKYNLKVGTISRLSKKYIENLINSMHSLSKIYPNFKFLLIIAGDDENKNILKKMRLQYKSYENLDIIFTGYLNPLGCDFFKLIDVFVGMGTASVNSISQKCATVNIDPRTNFASGIFGVDTFNFAYSESNNSMPIHNCIERFLKDKNLIHVAQLQGYKLFNSEYNISVCMKKLDNIIMNSSTNDYYAFPDHYTKNKLLLLKYRFINSGLFHFIYHKYIKYLKKPYAQIF